MCSLSEGGQSSATHQLKNQMPCIQSQIKKSWLLSSSICFQLWIFLSNHNTNISFLKQPIRIPTSQIALNILGRCIVWYQKGYEDCELQSHVPENKTFIGQQFYLVSSPLFDKVKKQHNALGAPGLEHYFKENPDSFNCHLSFNISNFANKPHKVNEQTTSNLVEENFEVKG
ncbi:hypothetical protein VP01_7246g1, partial [Puccinia sorghi]